MRVKTTREWASRAAEMSSSRVVLLDVLDFHTDSCIIDVNVVIDPDPQILDKRVILDHAALAQRIEYGFYWAVEIAFPAIRPVDDDRDRELPGHRSLIEVVDD